MPAFERKMIILHYYLRGIPRNFLISSLWALGLILLATVFEFVVSALFLDGSLGNGFVYRMKLFVFGSGILGTLITILDVLHKSDRLSSLPETELEKLGKSELREILDNLENDKASKDS